jgi:RecA-family ATPase
MASPAQNITRHYGGDWHGSYGSFPAPGHGKEDRGVTVKDTDGGDVVFNSFNDADWRELKDECRRLGFIPDREQRGSDTWRQVGSWEFSDADGIVIAREIRLEHPTKPKSYRPQRPDGRGGWITGVEGVERVLFRLPDILNADPAEPIYLTEGARKAAKLEVMGFLSTACLFGAKGWKSDYAKTLAGRTVVILPDNDDEGRGFAQRASTDIIAAGGRALTVELPGLPPKGDIIDWAGTADELRALTEAAVNPPAKLLPLIDPAQWQGREAPPREWAMQDWIPLRQATLLTGNGGVGKSLLAQMMSTCAALGLDFLGQEMRSTPAIYLTCEDDAEELWRRQGAICAALDVCLSDLTGKLFLAPMTGEEGNSLANVDSSGRLIMSDRWRELQSTVKSVGAGFVALDNASHLLTGHNVHNDIGAVATFLGMLSGLAITTNGAVLILHHPNKAGDDWLGSVAWENQVRSRLIMKPSDIEGDHDARSLQNPKANYGPSGGRLDFRWCRGALVRDEDLPPNLGEELAASLKATADNETFLKCLRQRTRERRAVSERRSPSFAPTVFAGMPEAKGLGKKRLEQAMDRLFRIGAIERAELWKGADRKPVFGLRETAEKGAGNGADNTVRERGERVPETAETRAGNAGNIYTIPKGISGAAHEAAAPFTENMIDGASSPPRPS